MSSNQGKNGGVQQCNSGFFGKMFGGGEKKSSGKCACGSGEEQCNCNCALKDHLKDCCGYGTLPKLVECPKIPPRSASPSGGSNCGCGGGAAAPPPPARCETVPAFNPNATCGSSATKTCGGGSGGKCPPMPPSDISPCIPSWLCKPPATKLPKYPVPIGAVILPISIGGRNSSSKGGKCGECGVTSQASGPPKVSANCPMVKPRCPGKDDKPDAGASSGGFFSKITSFFGGGK